MATKKDVDVPGLKGVERTDVPLDGGMSENMLRVADLKAPKGKNTIVKANLGGAEHFVARDANGKATGILSINNGKVETLYIDPSARGQRLSNQLYAAADAAGHDIANLGADAVTPQGEAARKSYLRSKQVKTDIVDDIVTPKDLGIPERKEKIFQQRTTPKPMPPDQDVLTPEHYGVPDRVDTLPQQTREIRGLPGDHDPGTKRYAPGLGNKKEAPVATPKTATKGTSAKTTATKAAKVKPASFEQWMEQADAVANKTYAANAQDIFDDAGVMYRDMYDRGVSPTSAVNQSVQQLHPADVKAMRQAAKAQVKSNAELTATTERYRSGGKLPTGEYTEGLPKPRSAVARRANSIAAEERIDQFRSAQDPRAVIASRNPTTAVSSARGDSIINQLLGKDTPAAASPLKASTFGADDFDAYMNTNPVFNGGNGPGGINNTRPSLGGALPGGPGIPAGGATTATGEASLIGRLPGAQPSSGMSYPQAAVMDGATAGAAPSAAAAELGTLGQWKAAFSKPNSLLQAKGTGAGATRFNKGTSIGAALIAQPVAHAIDDQDFGGHESFWDRAATGASFGGVASKGNPLATAAGAAFSTGLGAFRDDTKDSGIWKGLTGQGLSPRQAIIRDKLTEYKRSGDTANYNLWAKVAEQDGFAIPSSVVNTASPGPQPGAVDSLYSIIGQLGLSPEAQTEIQDELAMHQKLSALSTDPAKYMEDIRTQVIQGLPSRVKSDKGTSKFKEQSTAQRLALQQMVANIMQPAEQQFLTAGNLESALFNDLANKHGVDSELGKAYTQRGTLAMTNANRMAAASRAQASTLPGIAEMERIAQYNAQAAADQRAMANRGSSNDILSQYGLGTP